MNKKISLVGLLGTKSESGKYEFDTPTVDRVYSFITDRGLNELKVKELQLITATEELGNGRIAARLAQQYNSVCKVVPINWNASEDKSECARLRNVSALEDTDKIILLKKGSTFGGQGLLDAVEEKGKAEVLVYDLDTEESFVCKASEIKEKVKATKGTPKTIDYKGISQFYLDNHAAIIDTETTELGTTARVIQIAVIDSNTNHCYFQTLLKTPEPSSEGAAAVHGITDESRENAPTFEEVFPIIDALLSKFLMVGYNSPFDYTQIKQEYDRIGKKMPVLRFEDAMPLVSSFMGEKMKLTVACEKLGIQPGERSAITDCISLAEIIKYMAKENE